MKLLALAGVLITLATATAASAEPWERGRYPYEARHHNVCQEKASRLHQFERRSASDGRIDWRERRVIEKLRYDLRVTCGGFRHRG
jgi:hypothetical protein